MESQDKENKFEQLQRILDKIESNEEKLYSKNRKPKFLDLDIASFLLKPLKERKMLIFKKIEPLELNIVFHRILAILLESLNMKKTNLLLLDDIILVFIEYQKLLAKEVNIQNNFDRFMALQSDLRDPKYNFEDIKTMLFSESNIQYHKYLNSLNENFYNKIHNEFMVNLNTINNKYKKKIEKLELQIKAIRLKAKQRWPNLSFQGKVNDFLIKILNLNDKLTKYIADYKRNQALGTCISLSKHIKRFINKNLHPKYSFEYSYNNFIAAPSNNFIEVEDIIGKLDQKAWEKLEIKDKLNITEDIEAFIEEKLEPKDIISNIKFKYGIDNTISTQDSSAKNEKDEIIKYREYMLEENYIPDPILELNEEDMKNEHLSIDYDDMKNSKRKFSA